MKNFKFFISLSLLFCLGFMMNSCDSDDDQDMSFLYSSYIKYTHNGTTHEHRNVSSAESDFLILNGQTASINSQYYLFTSLWLPLDFNIGTVYNFTGEHNEEGDCKLRFASAPLNVPEQWVTSGSATVSSIDSGFIIGTFTASLINDSGNTVIIEDGEFMVEVYGLK